MTENETNEGQTRSWALSHRAAPEAGAPKPPSLPDDDSVACAAFPEGFWAQVDYMLHHPDEIRKSLRTDSNLWQLSRAFLLISVVMAAGYGAVMGATNLLQGSSMLMWAKLSMLIVTAVKVPVLFLFTLAIVLPPIYVSNAFVGARFSFRQMLASLLASVAVTTTILASMATVAFFFAVTSRSYDFIKLLHVLFYIYAGLAGLSYLVRQMKLMLAGRGGFSRRLFILWLALYMFVGTQLAWVLRPFVGSPGMQFQVFRPRVGNFYESVLKSLGNVLDD